MALEDGNTFAFVECDVSEVLIMIQELSKH